MNVKCKLDPMRHISTNVKYVSFDSNVIPQKQVWPIIEEFPLIQFA
jgi:hypothetical protein